MPDQARFLDFMDMIDGGGAGRMGDKFEGGGIFSALANLIATPYGSEDAGRKAKREAAYRAAGLLAPEEAEAEAEPIAAPAVRRTKPTRAELMSARAAEMERQRGLQQDVFDPRGPNQMPPLAAAPAYGPTTRGGQRGPRVSPIPAPSYAGMYMGEAGRGVPNLPRPVATTAALSPAGNTASGTAPVPPMSEQLAPMAPAMPTTAYPSAMSPSAPAMPQGVMSFRDFVDAERAAMSGADRYLDPANYQRGYARYLSSMGITPEMMGM